MKNNNIDVWIERFKRDQIVKIYIRERNGSKSNIIHSLGVDGMAQMDVVGGCSPGPDKPYLTIPMDMFQVIENELFYHNQRRLEDEIEKLKGEVRAKEAHIINLNEIFDKTLNKI